jgi:DNA-binding LacI/PurR family transcriptional regulator
MELTDKTIFNGDWLFGSGTKAASRILDMEASERPTAIFAFNDDMAYGCYNGLIREGLRVPEDISIVGFDNTDRYADMFPPISTVDVNLPAMVDCAAWYFMETLTGRAPRVIARIEIQTTFCNKDTVSTIKGEEL